MENQNRRWSTCCGCAAPSSSLTRRTTRARICRFATLGNVLPSCIVEFTATPARTGAAPSNVLHHVSAAELKAADMVKLPLRVITRHPSQRDQLLSEAITLRGDLEKIAIAEAQKTGEYLRPIMLIQAERVDACEPLRERLANEFGIAKDQVKISVGTQRRIAERGRNQIVERAGGAFHYHGAESCARAGIVRLPMCFAA